MWPPNLGYSRAHSWLVSWLNRMMAKCESVTRSCKTFVGSTALTLRSTLTRPNQEVFTYPLACHSPTPSLNNGWTRVDGASECMLFIQCTI
mmetsp:Transcript_66422/g.110444  ORF Transcript_66422/g.110444 Transcript_66422/m.110444 type:complete len:91 (-) Transcript_66422:116-388(-)